MMRFDQADYADISEPQAKWPVILTSSLGAGLVSSLVTDFVINWSNSPKNLFNRVFRRRDPLEAAAAKTGAGVASPDVRYLDLPITKYDELTFSGNVAYFWFVNYLLPRGLDDNDPWFQEARSLANSIPEVRDMPILCYQTMLTYVSGRLDKVLTILDRNSNKLDGQEGRMSRLARAFVLFILGYFSTGFVHSPEHPAAPMLFSTALQDIMADSKHGEDDPNARLLILNLAALLFREIRPTAKKTEMGVSLVHYIGALCTNFLKNLPAEYSSDHKASAFLSLWAQALMFLRSFEASAKISEPAIKYFLSTDVCKDVQYVHQLVDACMVHVRSVHGTESAKEHPNFEGAWKTLADLFTHLEAFLGDHPRTVHKCLNRWRPDFSPSKNPELWFRVTGFQNHVMDQNRDAFTPLEVTQIKLLLFAHKVAMKDLDHIDAYLEDFKRHDGQASGSESKILLLNRQFCVVQCHMKMLQAEALEGAAKARRLVEAWDVINTLAEFPNEEWEQIHDIFAFFVASKIPDYPDAANFREFFMRCKYNGRPLSEFVKDPIAVEWASTMPDELYMPYFALVTDPESSGAQGPAP